MDRDAQINTPSRSLFFVVLKTKNKKNVYISLYFIVLNTKTKRICLWNNFS